MAETKKKTQENVNLSVQWLDEKEAEQFGTAAGSHMELTTIDLKQKSVVFNPFVETSKVQSIDTQIEAIEKAYENGDITQDECIQAMSRAYKVNHSVGADVLYDNRLKVENRIDRYVAFKVASAPEGSDPDQVFEEARHYAITEILSKGKKQGSLAGSGWGGISQKRDIRTK